jgi:hypothetical protein
LRLPPCGGENDIGPEIQLASFPWGDMKPATVLRIVLSLILLQEICYLAGSRNLFISTLNSEFFSIALLSLFFILLRTRVSIREFIGVLILFGALVAFEFRVMGYPSTWPAWLSLLGVASLGVLFLRLIWAAPSQRRFAAFAVIPSLLFVVSEWCASVLLRLTELLHPKVLDLYLYSFDASTRIQLPFFVGRVFRNFPVFSQVCFLVYIGLPLAIGLTFAGCLLRDERTAWAACVAFLLTGPVGVLFYNLFPALGPIHLFGSSFPWHPLTLDQARRVFLEPIPLVGARNAIPSLHAAWIFLVVWYSRELSHLERTITAISAVLTLVATLGTGEHYFIDLVVAVPFTVLIIALTNFLTGQRRSRQLLPLSVGLGGVIAWLLALRHATYFFWRSPFIPWLAFAITFAACFLAFHRLGSLKPEPIAKQTPTDPLTSALLV